MYWYKDNLHIQIMGIKSLKNKGGGQGIYRLHSYIHKYR
jgi:hypothetical protein